MAKINHQVSEPEALRSLLSWAWQHSHEKFKEYIREKNTDKKKALARELLKQKIAANPNHIYLLPYSLVAKLDYEFDDKYLGDENEIDLAKAIKGKIDGSIRILKGEH